MSNTKKAASPSPSYFAARALSFLEAHPHIAVPVSCMRAKLAKSGIRRSSTEIENYCDELVALGLAVRSQVSPLTAVRFQAA